MNRLHLAAAGLILACWASACLYSVVAHDYGLLDRVTPIMVILAGYLFGDQLIRKRGGPCPRSSGSPLAPHAPCHIEGA